MKRYTSIDNLNLSSTLPSFRAGPNPVYTSLYSYTLFPWLISAIGKSTIFLSSTSSLSTSSTFLSPSARCRSFSIRHHKRKSSSSPQLQSSHKSPSKAKKKKEAIGRQWRGGPKNGISRARKTYISFSLLVSPTSWRGCLSSRLLVFCFKQTDRLQDVQGHTEAGELDGNTYYGVLICCLSSLVIFGHLELSFRLFQLFRLFRSFSFSSFFSSFKREREKKSSQD